ncbi:MAG: flippase-like domain-containing protein [Ignavibacteria bacterium]|nr:flippase-like domain-containing protein [Ignavibacteria bacterium]
MNGRSIVRVLIGTSILVVAVWFMMRGVDLSAMFDILKHADLVIAASCIPLVIGSHLMRAIRWRTLLRPTNHVTHLSTAFNSVMIGYAANTIVPRSGELIRPWVFARREGMPVATAMSSVLVERVIDVLTLLLAIALVMVLAPDGSPRSSLASRPRWLPHVWHYPSDSWSLCFHSSYSHHSALPLCTASFVRCSAVLPRSSRRSSPPFVKG